MLFFISNTSETFSNKLFAKFQQKLLEGYNSSISSLYLARNKDAIILYPYFICEFIQPFLLKPLPFCEIFCTYHCSCCPIVGNYLNVKKHRFHTEYIKIQLRRNTFLVSECIFKVAPSQRYVVWIKKPCEKPVNPVLFIFMLFILFRMHDRDTAAEKELYCIQMILEILTQVQVKQ